MCGGRLWFLGLGARKAPESLGELGSGSASPVGEGEELRPRRLWMPRVCGVHGRGRSETRPLRKSRGWTSRGAGPSVTRSLSQD